MSRNRERIVIPQRVINGGLDFKFETDPYDVDLRGWITDTEYTDLTTALNDALKPSRSKSVDTMLLATGALMVPLALWGVRHTMLTKKRKRLLKRYITDFNANHTTLHMRWNRRPESSLTLERRENANNNTGITTSPPISDPTPAAAPILGHELQ